MATWAIDNEIVKSIKELKMLIKKLATDAKYRFLFHDMRSTVMCSLLAVTSGNDPYTRIPSPKAISSDMPGIGLLIRYRKDMSTNPPIIIMKIRLAIINER